MADFDKNERFVNWHPYVFKGIKGWKLPRMNYCTKAERYELKMHMVELKVKFFTEAENRLQKDIDKDRSKLKKKQMKEIRELRHDRNAQATRSVLPRTSRQVRARVDRRKRQCAQDAVRLSRWTTHSWIIRDRHPHAELTLTVNSRLSQHDHQLSRPWQQTGKLLSWDQRTERTTASSWHVVGKREQSFLNVCFKYLSVITCTLTLSEM